MAQRIHTYFTKHKQIIEENLLLCEDPEDIEAIHNLRLSVKRIRVVGRLADMISDNDFDSKARLRGINKLFKSSGRLRDVQVTQPLMANLSSTALTPVIERLNRNEKKRRLKFENALASFNHADLDIFETGLKEALNGVSDKYAMQVGLTLLYQLEIEVHELFHGNAKEKRLHDIRTRLKDINYLNNIFDQELPILEQLNISLERLKELGEIAGAWHDSLNLQIKLQKFIKKHPEHVAALQGNIDGLISRKQELSQEYSCILINEMRI